jgi:hypothetical protein
MENYGNKHGKHVNVEKIWKSYWKHMANHGNPIHTILNIPIDLCKSGTCCLILSGWWFGTWILWLSIYWECHDPNRRTHIFQRGRAQPPTSYCRGGKIYDQHMAAEWRWVSFRAPSWDRKWVAVPVNHRATCWFWNIYPDLNENDWDIFYVYIPCIKDLPYILITVFAQIWMEWYCRFFGLNPW